MTISAPLRCLSVILLLLSMQAFAQQNDCSDVLRYAGRSVTNEEFSSTFAKTTYDKVCQGDQEKAGLNITAEITEMVDELPVPFKFGVGGTHEAIKTFCRQFYGEYKGNIFAAKYSSIVVSDAVAAWKTCVNATAVAFKPQLTDTQIVVGVQRKMPGPVTVQGVRYDTNLLDCKAPDSNTSANTVTADLNIRKTLPDNGYWTITCERKAKVLPDNSKLYEQADLAVITSGDTLVLRVPKSLNMPLTWARQIESRVIGIGDRVNSLKLECQAAENSSGPMAYPYIEATIPQAEAASGEWFVTGGGCRITGSDEPTNRGTPGGPWHNEPITASRRTQNGWGCKAGDPPNMAQGNVKITAQVIYCRAVK
jgi:hypothetical protein